MGKIASKLYNASRTFGRMGSKVNDIETILSGNPMKVLKRSIRKSVGKHFVQTARKLEGKIK